jgi:hypothetical protein
VSVKGGVYKGDLAKVVDTDPSLQVGRPVLAGSAHRPLQNRAQRTAGVCVCWCYACQLPSALLASHNRPHSILPQRCTIKVVPRLDLAAIANRKPEDARANFGKQPKVKPPAKPFNPDEVSAWLGGGRRGGSAWSREPKCCLPLALVSCLMPFDAGQCTRLTNSALPAALRLHHLVA